MWLQYLHHLHLSQYVDNRFYQQIQVSFSKQDHYVMCVECVRPATLGLCRTASRIGSVLMSSAQQGKQANRRMRIPLCSITPTRFRLLLPNVCRTQFNSNDTWAQMTLTLLNIHYQTWEMSVSHADANPEPMEMPDTLITCEQKGCIYRQGNGCFNERHYNEVILWTHSNSQSHTGQFSFPQVSTEHSADEADQKDHQLRYKLQKRGNIFRIR